MRRLPLMLSAAALVVAVLGSTPVGHAVGSAVPLFAKKAGYANRAGNAAALNGIKAAKLPRPGMLVPLGADGRFPASVGLGGAAGPKGDKGDKGDNGPRGSEGQRGPVGPSGPAGPVGQRGPTGPSGISGWSYFTEGKTIASKDFATWSVDCPGGKKALGGGVSNARPVASYRIRVIQSAPGGAAATGWVVTVAKDFDNYTITAYAWVICANVVS